MNDLLGFLKDYSSPANTFVLLAGLWFLRRIDASLEDVKTNHLPHIYERLGRLDGRTEPRKA